MIIFQIDPPLFSPMLCLLYLQRIKLEYENGLMRFGLVLWKTQSLIKLHQQTSTLYILLPTSSYKDKTSKSLFLNSPKIFILKYLLLNFSSN